MIYYVDHERINELKDFVRQRNIYSCRIACLLESYGTNHDFARFWLQYNDKGKVVSAVASYYGDSSVQLSEQSDVQELAELVEMMGCASVLCSRPLLAGESECGIVMSLCEDEKKDAVPSGEMQIVHEPDISMVYGLLKSCSGDGFEVPAYEDFLLDLSHKIRHGTALCTGLMYKDRLISSAMTVAQSEECAVIGAVAAEAEYRGRGWGSVCVRELCTRLTERYRSMGHPHTKNRIFIMRSKDRNESFYKKLGFINAEEFYIQRRIDRKKSSPSYVAG